MIDTIDVFLPIISLVVSSLLTIPVLKVLRKRNKEKTVWIVSWFAAIFIIAALTVGNLASKYYSQAASQPFVNITMADPSFSSFSTSFMIDGISVYMAVIFIGLGGIVLLYSVVHTGAIEPLSERYFAVMLIILAAIMGAVFSGDLLTLFIFWEASAAGSSFLMLYRRTPKSMYATLKYLVMIIMASAFIIYGLSIVYGITGTLNFWAVKQALIALQNKQLLVAAFIFIATGYAIEAAVVPFHMWLPDAYTAAPSSSSAFLSALVDQGSYYVLLRVLIYILTPSTILDWTMMLACFSALTMVAGNFLALAQVNVKRMIAYICVADVGYNLVAITSVTPLGMMGNLYFFLIGGMTTALAFMSVGILNRMGFESLEDFSGIGRKMPLTSLALLLGALSFAGIPPLGGFIAKYLVFTAAIEAKLSWLAVVGVITSVVQAAYLLRLINYMYLRKPKKEGKIREPRDVLIPVFVLVAAIIALGIYPAIVLNLMDPVTQQLPLIAHFLLSLWTPI
jgi:NADH-quinone oxidoreductase subunit N